MIFAMLNRMGNSSSYDEIEGVDTSLAKGDIGKVRAKSRRFAFQHFAQWLIQVAADNNDINEETLDGKNTTHATTLVVYHRKQFGPECPPKVSGEHSVRKRSIEAAGNFNDILDYSSRGKRPPVTTFLGTLMENTR